jgi:hypothetical protein
LSKCSKCQKEFSLTNQDKLLRNLVATQSKILSPLLADACKEAKEWCNDCWKERVKPIAESLAGVKIE